ncbi:Acid protease [Mycena indigotica]|uniref:Acid protease n=1 Tax=Mycena indigotica TaxID=2126181 RepID=A0A8H6W9B0_9AGAR|nr:Acid protease [Mycena indigotica]KAF7306423.1 Acid protease [Mycena indigotica]
MPSSHDVAALPPNRTRFTYQTLGPNSVSPSHLSAESRYSTLGAGSGGPTQRISHMYRGSDDSGRPVAHSADSSLSLLSGQHPQDFDSPPPYLDASASSSSGGPAAGPVPLAPLRKGRRLS